MRCWYCGHIGHIRRHCFKHMRQHRRHIQDANVVLTHASEVAMVVEYANDSDVMFASISLANMSLDGTLSPHWLLDADASFHIMSHRDWFRSFSSGRLGCIHLGDGLSLDILGAGDIYLSLPNSASYTLHHVQYVS